MSEPILEPLGVLVQAQDSFGIPAESPSHEWPFNILSQQAVKFADGRIGRASNPLPPADPAEQKLCDKVAEKVGTLLNKMTARPAKAVLEPFRSPVIPGSPVPETLTPEVVRAAFGGTLHPWATVTIDPIGNASVYSLANYLFGSYPQDFKTEIAEWKTVRTWFKQNKNLTGGWLVSVEAKVAFSAQAVRLLVGLTKAGSLAGIVTVGKVGALEDKTPPVKLRQNALDAAARQFRPWINPATGRIAVRLRLRSVPDQEIADFGDSAASACRRLKPSDRIAHWRSGISTIPTTQELVVSPAWEAVQRCITAGWLDPQPGTTHGTYLIMGGWFGHSTENTFHCFDAGTVQRTAGWLSAHNDDWLKQRYADLRATDYARFMSEEDFLAVTSIYQQTRDFYAQAAANGLAVVTEALVDAEPTSPATPAPTLAKKVPACACVVDADMLAPLLPCMGTDDDEETAARPSSDLLPSLVRYTCGRIARNRKNLVHNHPPGEVDRCRELEAEAERLLARCEPDEDQGGPYLGFFATANMDDPVPTEFTESFVREWLFNGTIPRAIAVEVQPLSAGAVWHYGDEAEAFVQWFTSVPGLHGWAFVAIGTSEDVGGASHPRLALAFTDKGSVVGACGYVVWA